MIFEYIEFPMDIAKMNECGKQGWRYMFHYIQPGSDSEVIVVMGRRS